MGVSMRCKGLNLLNHCKQVQKPSQLEYNFTQIKEYSELKWKATLIIDDIHYVSIKHTQKEALLDLINENESILREKLLQ